MQCLGGTSPFANLDLPDLKDSSCCIRHFRIQNTWFIISDMHPRIHGSAAGTAARAAGGAAASAATVCTCHVDIGRHRAPPL